MSLFDQHYANKCYGVKDTGICKCLYFHFIQLDFIFRLNVPYVIVIKEDNLKSSGTVTMDFSTMCGLKKISMRQAF